MKILGQLILLLSILPTYLGGQSSANWQIGGEAAAIFVPYQLSAPQVGVGTQIGGFVQKRMTDAYDVSVSLGYRKLDGLPLERQENATVIFPEGVFARSEQLLLSGFTAFHSELRLNRKWKAFRRGQLNVRAILALDLQLRVRAFRNTHTTDFPIFTSFSEQGGNSFISQSGSQTRSVLEDETTDDNKLVPAAGLGVSYAFYSGPEVQLSVVFDVRNRFSLFETEPDAQLTQVQLGFSYPFGTIFENRKN